MTNVLFIHHSVGRYLIAGGQLRRRLREQSETNAVNLWDVDYKKLGAHGPDGEAADIGIDIPEDNTDPDGFLRLLTAAKHAAVRERITAFDAVIHKACYPASNLRDEGVLAERIVLYRALLDACVNLPTFFVLATPPPLTPLRTSRAAAQNAMTFATWFADVERPANVDVFDLHRVLRSDGGRYPGALSPNYRPLAPWDSHPNNRGRNAGAAALAVALAPVARRSNGMSQDPQA